MAQEAAEKRLSRQLREELQSNADSTSSTTVA